MPDGSTSFDINLRTKADVSGVEKVEAALKGLDAVQARAGTSGRNMGNAMLQASRGIQDMQYGLEGAVNNLEGIASALGLGAGVAGVVTVLAVAVQQLGPKVVDWFKSLDKEGAALDKLTDRHKALAAALMEGFNPAENAAKEASDEFTQQLAKEKTEIDNAKSALDAYIGNLRLKNQIQDTAEQASERRQIEDIRASDLPADEKTRQEAAVRAGTLINKGAREEDAMRQEEAAAQLKVEADQKIVALRNQQIEVEQRNLARAELVAKLLDPKNPGSLAGLQEQIARKMGTDPTAAGKSVEQMQQEIDALQATLSQRQQLVDDYGSEFGIAGTDKTQGAADFKARETELIKQREAWKGSAENNQRAADDLRATNTIKSGGRAGVLDSALSDLSRGQAGQGVFSPQPASPFGSAPLPSFSAPGQMPANPFGLLQPLPGASTSSPPPGLGRNAPLPQNDALIKATQAAAESNAAANAALLAALEKQNADNKKLTEQVKNMRS